MNHKIGLKGVSYSYDKKTYKALERTMYNCWEILGGAKFPLYLKLQAISGEIKETVIDSLKPGFEHDTGVQFTVPKDMYFTLDDFKKIDKLFAQDLKYPIILILGVIFIVLFDYSRHLRG